MTRVTSMKKLAALVVVATALAGSSFAGVNHSAPSIHGGKRLSWCPPMC
jgi:hypothetical protein